MKTFCALVVLAVAVVAQQPSLTACQTCEYVVGRAEHHMRGPTDKGELQIFLLADCESLRRFQGEVAVNQCVALIDQNIDVIYNDVYNGKRSPQICADIKQC